VHEDAHGAQDVAQFDALLTQALVSAAALVHDEQARAKFLERVVGSGGDAAAIPTPVRSVVLAIAG
jgi:hypothetical protein